MDLLLVLFLSIYLGIRAIVILLFLVCLGILVCFVELGLVRWFFLLLRPSLLVAILVMIRGRRRILLVVGWLFRLFLVLEFLECEITCRLDRQVVVRFSCRCRALAMFLVYSLVLRWLGMCWLVLFLRILLGLLLLGILLWGLLMLFLRIGSRRIAILPVFGGCRIL